MGKDILTYKHYRTRVGFDTERQMICGRVEGLADEVTYACETAEEVEAAFHAAVDDYLARCRLEGRAPDREYKGSFNVRIDPATHRELAMLVLEHPWETMNALVERAIEEFLAKPYRTRWEVDAAERFPTQSDADAVGSVGA